MPLVSRLISLINRKYQELANNPKHIPPEDFGDCVCIARKGLYRYCKGLLQRMWTRRRKSRPMPRLCHTLSTRWVTHCQHIVNSFSDAIAWSSTHTYCATLSSKAICMETVSHSWTSHVWRPGWVGVYLPPQPIRLICTPPHIGVSTDSHRFSYRVFLHIWIAYRRWRIMA